MRARAKVRVRTRDRLRVRLRVRVTVTVWVGVGVRVGVGVAARVPQQQKVGEAHGASCSPASHSRANAARGSPSYGRSSKQSRQHTITRLR